MNWAQARQWIRRIDWALLLAVLVLMVLGVLFIYSASYRGEGEVVEPFYRKQVLWLLAGLLAFLGVTVMDYHRIAEAAGWFYGISIVLLFLVLIFGEVTHGATRWLKFFGFNVQPSELAKLAALLALARFLSRPGRSPERPRLLWQAGIMVGLPFLLILKEPDLGTAAMLLPMTLVMLFVAGVPLRSLALVLVIGLLLMPFAWFALGEYQQNRLLVFFDPGREPLGAGWNKIQSEIAVGSGGLTGKGYLQGTQNVLGFLPRTVAPTDFIFSVIAEEMGFVGSALVVSLYAAVLVGIVRAALLARDALGCLLCMGMASIVFCHVFVNIAMTVGLMPITGLPLPLISYGGSFTVSTMMGLGLVQSVYARRYRR